MTMVVMVRILRSQHAVRSPSCRLYNCLFKTAWYTEEQIAICADIRNLDLGRRGLGPGAWNLEPRIWTLEPEARVKTGLLIQGLVSLMLAMLRYMADGEVECRFFSSLPLH